MTIKNNTSLTGLSIENFIENCSIHAQFCLATQTLLENGAEPDHLKDVVNVIREQAEFIESLSAYLAVNHVMIGNLMANGGGESIKTVILKD